MKILVAIKRVVDANVRIRLKSDKTGIELSNVKMSMNPFDEIAVEAAIRFKESGTATEVVAVSMGDLGSQETLRVALALGVDRAIHIHTETIDLQPLNVAKMLQAIVKKESPRLVILGKQAIDGDNNQTGQMLAALLGWPQGTFASHIEIVGEEVIVTREVDGGLETLALRLPTLVTTDLRLNQPRYASLPNIMKAKQKPLEVFTPASLGINMSSHITTLQINPPSTRQEGIKVKNASELIQKLKNEAKVI